MTAQATLPIESAPGDTPKDGTAAARARRYRARKRDGRDAEQTVTVTHRDADRDGRDAVTQPLLARQLEIRLGFNEAGDLLLIQENWPDDDQTIIVVEENIFKFIDRLCDAVGIPSFPSAKP